MQKLLIVLVIASFSIAANAYSEVKVCGKYQRADSSWSHGYKLTGFKLDNRELEDALRRPHDFPACQNYFLIRWKKGGYTYYKVDSKFPSSSWTTVRDQNNRKWKFQNSWTFCN